MDVRDAGRHLMEIASRPADEAEWQRASDAFMQALHDGDDPQDILALLAADETDDLPIAAKTAAYERLLELGVRTAPVLRGFADHLWFHGPDDDDRAAALTAEADRLDQEAGRT